MQWKEFDNPQQEKQRLKALLKKNPQDAQAWYELATVYASNYIFSQALACCRKALSFDSNNVTFLSFFVYASMKADDYEGAIDALVKLIELKPDESDYYIELVIDSLCGLDSDLALQKVKELKEIGKDSVAHTLVRWIWNP